MNFSRVTPRKTEMKSPSITKPMITTPNKGNLCSSDVKELKKTALLKKSSLDLQKIKLKFL